MNIHGHTTAGSASSGRVWCSVEDWRALQVGNSPYTGRKWLKLQVKGATSLAVKYINKDSEGNFTTPTGNVNRDIIYPANSIVVEAVGDGITVYGRAVAKAGATATGVAVPVIEYK